MRSDDHPTLEPPGHARNHHKHGRNSAFSLGIAKIFAHLILDVSGRESASVGLQKDWAAWEQCENRQKIAAVDFLTFGRSLLSLNVTTAANDLDDERADCAFCRLQSIRVGRSG